MTTPRAVATSLALASFAIAAPSAAQFYDPAPLLASLRPGVRAGVARSAGLRSLDLLPRYDLTVTIDPNGRRFTLNEEVWFTNTERVPLPDLVFRVYGNAVRPSSTPAGAGRPRVVPAVRFVRGQCSERPCTVSEETPSVLTVRPATPLAPGQRIRVTFALEGNLPEIDASRTNILAQGMESMASMGASEGSGDYGLLAHGDGITSLANFYAVLARRRGAHWERSDSGVVGDFGSDDLSNVHAFVDTPAGWTVATTGTTVGTTRSGAAVNARSRIEVAAGVVRDFAVLAGPTLQVATRRVGEVELRSYFLPAHRRSGERVLDVAASSLEVYERRFGQYPYVDLDIVEAPLVGGAGGVEFPGLVTVASMFYRGIDEGVGSGSSSGGSSGLGGLLGGLLGGGSGGLGGLLGGLADINGAMARMLPSMLEFVTAHEVAHQYWHGLVGSDSREHPFIDESLAQWSAQLYIEERYGAERARREGDTQVKMNYHFMRLLGNADAAVDQPASAFTSPIAYAGLVYGKGPYLYNALRASAGDAVFFRAMRRYVDTWRFRTAPPTGFVDALAAENPSQNGRFRSIARRWLRETHGDEDLGQPDFGQLLGPMMGGSNGQPTPQGGQQLQQAIDELMRQLQ